MTADADGKQGLSEIGEEFTSSQALYGRHFMAVISRDSREYALMKRISDYRARMVAWNE
jgi:hypothetical protein